VRARSTTSAFVAATMVCTIEEIRSIVVFIREFFIIEGKRLLFNDESSDDDSTVFQKIQSA
jgi:hypothetical protein